MAGLKGWRSGEVFLLQLPFVVPCLAFEMLVWLHRPWGSARQQEEEGCVMMDPNI